MAQQNEKKPLNLSGKGNIRLKRSTRQTDLDKLLTKPVVEKGGGDPANERSDRGADTDLKATTK